MADGMKSPQWNGEDWKYDSEKRFDKEGHFGKIKII